jgi:hypothetical protein
MNTYDQALSLEGMTEQAGLCPKPGLQLRNLSKAFC